MENQEQKVLAKKAVSGLESRMEILEKSNILTKRLAKNMTIIQKSVEAGELKFTSPAFLEKIIPRLCSVVAETQRAISIMEKEIKR